MISTCSSVRTLVPALRSLLYATLAVLSLGLPIAVSATLAADYVWDPTSFYNGTHPVSKNPWSTQWVPKPGATEVEGNPKSIQVTVAKGTTFYNYIVIPQSRLGAGTEFTAVLQCRIAASTSLPKCFYMFARNSVSEAHDIWHKWVGDPGTSR
ncbi:MAG: hypothetical protein ACAI35_04985, partial [Candidatus Methylacidiphilales bacterium]